MLTFYIVSAVLGGVVILFSSLSGHHTEFGATHFDHSFDHSGAGHLGHDGHAGHGSDADSDHTPPWVYVLNIRFWTYMLATFGCVGLLLTTLSNAKEPLIVIASLATGMFAGAVVAYAYSLVRVKEVSSGIRMAELIGSQAKVLVPVRKDVPGKIRCEYKGEFLDVMALADSEDAIPQGKDVIVISVEDDKALVMSRAAIFDEENEEAG